MQSQCNAELSKGTGISKNSTTANSTGPRGGVNSAASHDQRLPFATKVAFGSGAVGEAVYLGLFNTFITLYYNQVVGLSNSLIGMAVMLALVADAITDPIVGVTSDRWRSPHGRRHPFLWVAPIPLALSIYCIFNPPAADGLIAQLTGAGDQVLWFVWLAAFTILSRFCLTLYSVPHLALGAELSKNQHERSQLFSANTVFLYVSGASFAFAVWTYFSTQSITRADGVVIPGQLNAAAYAPVILIACAIVIIGIWTCAAGTVRYVPHLSQALQTQPRLGPVQFLQEIFSTLKNRNYLLILCGYFFFMISSGIYDTLNTFINTYFWELQPDQIRWLMLVGAPSAACGALLSPLLMRRFDRKPVMVSALAGTLLFAQLVINLRLLGLMPANGSPMLLPALVANAAGFTFTLGVGSVAVFSMIGDIVDEDELNTGMRREGLFYSARTFFAKASSSFGHFVAGVALDLFVRLPFGAVPGELDSEVLTRMGIVAGPIMGLAALVSLLIYSRHRLNRERHAEILAALRERDHA